MINALFTAASGMVAQSIKQDVIANNIANAQTPGFKRERVISTSFQEALQKSVADIEARKASPATPFQAMGVRAEAANDTSEGPIRPTGNNLQFAIEGAGTFEVGSGDSVRQTRNGSFTVDSDGELATPDGEKVQGKSGAIKLPVGDWSVSPTGAVLSKGAEVDQIKINGAEAGKTQVAQGYLEESNVSVIREMVDMISNLRSYEANQKVVMSVDGTLDKMINEVGKV
jgi:flagellar basal-body rod protein FlgF